MWRKIPFGLKFPVPDAIAPKGGTASAGPAMFAFGFDETHGLLSGREAGQRVIGADQPPICLVGTRFDGSGKEVAMRSRTRAALAAAGVLLSTSLLGAPQAGAAVNVKAGILSCNVSSGWGIIFGSSRSLHCIYSPTNGKPERYVGKINKFGVDIGYLSSAVIVWAVFAPAVNAAPGTLAGTYAGATGSATLGYGIGANVLVGGGNDSITLQPLSIEGNQGLNVAGGVAAMSLTPGPASN